MRLVVQVKNEVQLLLVGTWRVGTIVSGGGVTGNTRAVDDTTDVAEERSVVVRRNTRGKNTAQGVNHTVTDAGVRGRRQGGVSSPEGSDRGTGGDGGRSGSAVDGGQRGRNTGELGLQVVEVGQSGDGARGNGHQSVVVGLLEVHVHDTTGPDVGHVRTVDGLDLLERSWLHLVTSVLGEEDGDAQVLVLRGDVGVAGLLERRLTAPFVHVDTEEVCSDRRVAAGKVVGQVDTDGNVVVGGVADRNASVVHLLDVGLGVTNGGLDVGRGGGVVDLVGDLVTSKETQDVGVVGELVDDSGVSGEQVDVPLGVVSVDGLVWLRQVGNDIDAGVGQCVHTLGVVERRVQCVHSDDVGLQLLHVGDVSGAHREVAQGVHERRAAGHVHGVLLVRDTLHQELRAIVGVVELVTQDLDRRKIGGGYGCNGGSCREKRFQQHGAGASN